MKRQIKFLTVMLVAFFMPLIIWAESVDEIIQSADIAYQENKKDTAKELYLQAAKLGSATAHFALAYKYVLPPEDKLNHLVNAAMQGHERALGYALDRLFYAPLNLNLYDPEGALDLLNHAKQKNAEIKGEYPSLKRCIEAGHLDIKKFIHEHELSDDIRDADLREPYPYYLWELAEDAVNTERFGKPEHRLVMQLVCRGGFARFDFQFAVYETFKRWKEGKNPHFDICENVSSTYGMTYCRERMKSKDADKRTKLIYPKVDDRVWSVAGIDVLPSCLEIVWASGDNYDEYQEQFPSATEIVDYPGKHLGADVPLAPISVEWGPPISLAKKFEECNTLSASKDFKKDGNFIEITDPKWTHREEQDSYRLIAKWDGESCEKLLPQFVGNCHSMVFVIRNEYTNFSIANNTYAHVTHEDQDFILPVTNNLLMDEFLELMDERKKP